MQPRINGCRAAESTVADRSWQELMGAGAAGSAGPSTTSVTPRGQAAVPGCAGASVDASKKSACSRQSPTFSNPANRCWAMRTASSQVAQAFDWLTETTRCRTLNGWPSELNTVLKNLIWYSAMTASSWRDRSTAGCPTVENCQVLALRYLGAARAQRHEARSEERRVGKECSARWALSR